MRKAVARAAVLVGAGTLLLAIPTFVTNTSGPSSFEPLPSLLVAMLTAVGWRSFGERLTRYVWSAALVLTAAAVVAALLPSVRGVVAGMFGHENLFAASAVTIALVGVLTSRSRWSLWAHLAAGGLAALALGSRSAALGALVCATVVAVWIASIANAGKGRRLLPVVGLLVAVVAIGVFSPGVRDTVRALPAMVGGGQHDSANLVPASEQIGRPPWTLDGVQVVATDQRLGDDAVLRLVDIRGSSTARAQVKVSLPPGALYTLSVALKPSVRDGEPGLTGWAPAGEAGPESVVRVSLAGGAAMASASGVLTVSRAAAQGLADGWYRLSATISNPSPSPVDLWVGPTPDTRPGGPGRSASFARLMLVVGTSEQAYAPTFARPDAVVTALSRARTYTLAWDGFLEAPVLGHGLGSYVEDQLASASDDFSFAHAHNALLHTLYERGAVGGIGLVAYLVGLLVLPAGDPRWRAVVLGVAAMNLTDTTLWTAGVAVPLGVAAGLTVSAALSGGPSTGSASMRRGSRPA